MQHPEKVGKYMILERIGRGGMGYVYKAVDPILKRDVAIKCMLKDFSDDEELRTRFMREAQSAGGLRHPNVVTIYDLGEDENGCPYIAMEFLTGTDLEHVIKNKMVLGLLKKLDIIIQACQGLGYAHSKGIVHRDIKPANLRLLDNGEVKIMDFGIAKIAASHFTRTGMIMGTPHYMSPEQIRGEKVDGRADIFSLGVVLYELLVYRKPYPGDNPTAVLFKIMHSDPEPLVDASFVPPEGLQQIVLRALAKKAEQRYQTCGEFTSDLLEVYAQLQQKETQQFETPSYLPTVGRTPAPSFRRASQTPKPGVSSTPRPQPTPAAGTLRPAPQPASPTAATQLLTPPATASAAPTALQPPTQLTVAKTDQAASVKPPVVRRLPSLAMVPAKKWILAGVLGVLSIAIFTFLIFGIIKTIANRQTPSEAISAPPVPKNVMQNEHEPEKKEAPAAPVRTSVVPAAPPEAAIAPPGWLTLNIQPWAEIREIKDEKGNSMAPTVALTPCRMQLQAGIYEITLANSQFKPLVFQVEIKSNETTIINRKMDGFDYGQAVDSMGL